MVEKVFNIFFGLLFQEISHESNVFTYKIELFETAMQHMGLSKTVRSAFRGQVVQSDSALTVESVSDEEMRITIDIAYTILCEHFGPLAADDYMANVIQKMENHSEANQFPIRQYL